MGRPENKQRGRGRVPHYSADDLNRESKMERQSLDRRCNNVLNYENSTSHRRESYRREEKNRSSEFRKITLDHDDAEKLNSTTDLDSLTTRTRRHREEATHRNYDDSHTISKDGSRQRKRRRQEDDSASDRYHEGVLHTNSKTNDRYEERGQQRRHGQKMDSRRERGNHDEMPHPRNLEPRQSESIKPDKGCKNDERSHIRGDHDTHHRNGSRKEPRHRSPAANERNPKRRHSSNELLEPRVEGYEPVRLSPRNEASLSGNDTGDFIPPQDTTTFRQYSGALAEKITFFCQSPSRLPGPPDPFHPPSTTAQLRILLLIGFLGSQTPAAASSGSVNPDVPIFRQRLHFPCPIHSALITRNMKEFFSFHRQIPSSFLRCLRDTVLASQLNYLSKPQDDPLIGHVPSPIKIEKIRGGGVIIDTFDFIRCDRLVRSAFRPDHPYSIRSLWDRNRTLVRLSDGELRQQIGEDIQCYDGTDIDNNGLPEPKPKLRESTQISTSPLLNYCVPSYDGFDFNSNFGSQQFSRSLLGGPATGLSQGQPTAMQLGVVPQRIVMSTQSTAAIGTASAPKVSKTSFTDGMNIEELLSAPSAKEKQIIDSSAELRDLLTVPTAKHSITTRTFQSRGGSKVQQICPHGTRQDCLNSAIEQYNQLKSTNINILPPRVCGKIHFRRIMFPHTDLSLGDCSYLDTCRHMASCRFVHYEVDLDVGTEEQKSELLERMESAAGGYNIGTVSSTLLEEKPAQWITCDVRRLDWTIFRGKIKVLMADPPWDIHMDLPYGTMTDNEMKSLRLDQVQDEGCLFLWVTGRAMELGRECMQLWGYKRVEEIVWVKTNQLHRVIRTGRTGHWLNHSKEHCLVGIKGDPKLNRYLDTDLIVAEVRETSRKPDEIYRIIERLCPGPYKLELFGRQHNVRNNWITLGNQLDGVRLNDLQLIQRYNDFATKSGLSPYDSIKEDSLHQQPTPPGDHEDKQSRSSRGTKLTETT